MVGKLFVCGGEVGGPGVKWKWSADERRRIPPIHILHVAIRVEEIVTLPMGWEGRQTGRVELRGNLFAAAEDGVAVIDAFDELSHVAEVSVIAALVLKWASEADAVVIVVEVAGTGALNLGRIAAEVLGCAGEGDFRGARFGFGGVVDEHLIPVDFEIRDKADAASARRQLACKV